MVSMKQLLESGVHFGHQTKKWNPKMKPYIYTQRNGIYIIDLQKSSKMLKDALEFVKDLSKNGGKILFVGTKKQAREAVELEANRAGMMYVNHSWKGGLLTNFSTIRKRIDYMFKLEEMEEDGSFEALPKKEVIGLKREMAKLQKFFNGIRSMTSLPDALFIIDQTKEKIAIHEAKLLGIPVIGVVDTNADPDDIDYPIPGNDDAISAIKLLSGAVATAVIEGRAAMDEELSEEEQAPVVKEAAQEEEEAPVAEKVAQEEEKVEATEEAVEEEEESTEETESEE